MKLLVMSDLHLEFPAARKYFRVPQHAIDACDVIVLAGDIAVGTKGLYWAYETFHPSHTPVVYLAGNHTFYGGHISKVSIELQRVAKDLGIHLLDNSGVTFSDPQGSCPDHGVRLIGATLWTDFRLFGNDPESIGKSMHHAKHYISDFSCITFGSTGWMTPADSVKIFNVSAQYIADELDKPFAGKTVVVTHHLPSKKSVAARFAKDYSSAAFASHLDHLVAQSDLWIHGHTHDSFDYLIADGPQPPGWICTRCSAGGTMLTMSSTYHSGTCTFCGRRNVDITNSQDFRLPSKPGRGRVVCNPRGYPIFGMEVENRQFLDDLVIEV